MTYAAPKQAEPTAWTFEPRERVERVHAGVGAIVIHGDQTGLGWRAAIDETSALLALYSFANYSDVRRVLVSSEEARALLFDVFPHVRTAFGDAARLTLEVLEDPDDGASLLTLLVQTGRDPEDALRRLHAFDEQWWREVAVQTDALVIDVE
jgi:hypothetical protein